MKKLIGRLSRRQVEALEQAGEVVLFSLQCIAALLVMGVCLELLWQPGRIA